MRHLRYALLALAALVAHAAPATAQGIEWGVKAGASVTSVAAVTDYYDFTYCCAPGSDGIGTTPSRGTGLTVGAFVGVPVTSRFSVQFEALRSSARHSVTLPLFQSLNIAFTRDSLEAAALAAGNMALSPRARVYVAAGPVFGFRTGERFSSSDPNVVRGDPETDVYALQATPYAAPELLRNSLTSLTLNGGLIAGRLVIEARFSQALHSMFKDDDALVAGFVSVGGHEATLRRLVTDFGPLLRADRQRNLTFLAGVRF
jgi:hypothetical protein